MAITKYHTQIEPIAQAYTEAISERKIKDEIVKKHGSYILEPQAKAEFELKATEYRLEQLRIASDKVQVIQEQARQEADSLLTKYESEKVDLLTGSELTRKYAKRHNIDNATAETRLRDYAKVKTAGFDRNSIADQYSALMNASKGNFSSDDGFVLSQLQKEYGIRISQVKAEAENVMRVVNANPHNLIDEVMSGGHAILKKLANQ